MIARPHGPHLRDRDVRFVDHDQRVVGEEIEQRVRSLARLSARQRATVVFDARTEPRFTHQLDVVSSAGLQPLRFEHFAFLLELLELLGQFRFDFQHGFFNAFLRHHEMPSRVHVGTVQLFCFFAGQRVDDRQALDFIPPHLDAERKLFVGGPDFNDIAARPEFAARDFEIVPFVLNVDQFEQQAVAIDLRTDKQRDHHVEIVLGRPEPVDAAHAGDDDDVAATDQGTRRQESQPVDFLVDRRVLFDIDVPLRDVRFRLVVVVVADEVRNGVVRKELAELTVELCRQRLIV